MDRAKRTLGYLAVSVFLGGGCVALATMEPNPLNWAGPIRPLSVLIVFLFFQWLYAEKDESCHEDAKGRVGSYKELKDREQEEERL